MIEQRTNESAERLKSVPDTSVRVGVCCGDLRSRFTLLFDERLDAFRKESLPDQRRRRAVEVMNVFRALMTGPSVQDVPLTNCIIEYRNAIEEITAAVSLPWTDVDTQTVTLAQADDVARLQAILFDPERHPPFAKDIGMFGALSVEGLNRSYGSDGEHGGASLKH